MTYEKGVEIPRYTLDETTLRRNDSLVGLPGPSIALEDLFLPPRQRSAIGLLEGEQLAPLASHALTTPSGVVFVAAQPPAPLKKLLDQSLPLPDGSSPKSNHRILKLELRERWTTLPILSIDRSGERNRLTVDLRDINTFGRFVDAAGVDMRASQLWSADGATAGVGLRVIFPDFHRMTLRVDYARPLIGRGRSPLSFGTGQQF